jgi:hypothetical protein
MGIRTPDCRFKSGYMSLSTTGAVYVLKKPMYLDLFDMIPDIRYDIRYDISVVLVLESTEARRSRNVFANSLQPLSDFLFSDFVF